MKASIKFLLIILSLASSIGKAQCKERLPRIIVTTDGEIDDKSSFVRYLMYCNHFKTEGLIYTNSKWQRHGHGVVWMQEYIDKWDKYRDNLLKHESGFPTAEELKSVIFAGNMDENYLHHSGALYSDGAIHILNVLLDRDPRPVWILAWGGTNTIAQALSILTKDYSPKEINKALSKIRIYAIDDQDETGKWIRKNFPQILFIRSWQFTALNYQHEGHPYSNDEIFSNDWMTKNIKQNHGDLGASYPQSYFSEGDSPSFFYFIRNGLYAPEHPEFGCWGGRFVNQGNNFYADAIDGGDRLHGQWIWLKDIQNDFAARMDWCVSTYEQANHHPIISKRIPSRIHAKPGDTVNIDANGCTDPDNEKLSYEWFYYAYAGTNPYSGNLIIEGGDTPNVKVSIPEDATGKELHLILKIRDDAVSSLVSYKRIIIIVK